MIPVSDDSFVAVDAELEVSPLAPTSIVVVVDDRVDDRFVSGVLDSCRRACDRVTVIEVTGGESLKTVSAWQGILERLQEVGLDRRGLLVAVGGGAVGDAVGFAAATWLRGVDWIGVPTTLLAMVDAHIGGKTAINLAGEKNRVGAFHLPRRVHVDRAALVGLPRRELLSGWGEVLKTALIGDTELFATFEDGSRGPDVEGEPSHDTIRRCIAVKAAIVREDPREGDRRRVLNLGHTLGHAIEALGGVGERSHGEAVAIGLAFAARVAQRLGVGDASLEPRVRAILSRWQLADAWPADRADALIELMLHDKKTVDGRIHMALPVTVGQIEVHPVEPDLLATCLQDVS